MPSVILGNTAPVEPTKPDPASDQVERVPRPDLGNTVTVFPSIPEALDLEDQATLVRKVFESHHSNESPAWVESDEPLLAGLIARKYDIEIGRPDDWDETPPEEVSPLTFISPVEEKSDDQ